MKKKLRTPKLLNKDVAKILDVVYQNAPEEPDWSAVKEAVFNAKFSSTIVIELLRVLWLYAEDTSAFEQYLLTIKD